MKEKNFAMPSTRKQKAREKRSRHSYVMSDMEILDILLGTFPVSNLGNEPENEQDTDSVSTGLQ